ncbi:hypothetical protein QYM36_006096, partial [Artemia franciscana]
MESKGRGKLPICGGSFQKETKQIPKYILRGQKSHKEDVPVLQQRKLPDPPSRSDSLFHSSCDFSEKISKSEIGVPKREKLSLISKRGAPLNFNVPEPVYATATRDKHKHNAGLRNLCTSSEGSATKEHSLKRQDIYSRNVCSERSEYVSSQLPKPLQKFPVSLNDRSVTPPESGIFLSELGLESKSQLHPHHSHTMSGVSSEQKSDSVKNSKVGNWMSSWLLFRHRRKSPNVTTPVKDRDESNVQITDAGAQTSQMLGPRARFNERKERSRIQNRNRSCILKKEILAQTEDPASTKQAFSWRTTSGPIPPRLEAQTPPLRAPKLITPPEPDPNPWSSKHIEVGLLEPRALTAFHSITDQDRLSATLGKIFKASPHLRNALAHHFGVRQNTSFSAPSTTNEAVVLAVGIDLYIEEVFQQLDSEGRGFVTDEDFILLCEVLSLPKSLPSSTKRLSLEQFRSRLFEHFVASFEKPTEKRGNDVLKTQVTVSRRAGILDKISHNIDKLLSTLELEETECICAESEFKESTQVVCPRCKRNSAGTRRFSNSDETVRLRVRDLQIKVLQQQKEIHALREVVEDMRMALQSSDAENIALKVILKKHHRLEEKKGIDKLVEELRKI